MEAVSGAFLAGWIVLNFPSFPIDTRFDERFGGDEPIDGACTFTCEMIPALAKAVEKYVKDLETLDELRDSAHAHDGVDRPTLFASAETLDELQN